MNTIVCAIIAIGLCSQTQSRTLTTVDGDTYANITAQRIDPDGLYIEYTMPGGGLGMSKIKFERLTRAQQKQYGLDAETASDYEAQVAQANEDCSQELIRRYQIAQDTRRQRDLENERAYNGRMNDIRQLNASLAADFYASCKSTTDGHGGGLTYTTETSASPTTTETSYSPVVTGDLFPNRGITTRSH